MCPSFVKKNKTRWERIEKKNKRDMQKSNISMITESGG